MNVRIGLWIGAVGCVDPLLASPLEVVEGGAVCGVEVPTGSTFVVEPLDADRDDDPTGRIDQLGALSNLTCVDRRCSAEGRGLWDLTLAGIDATGGYDAEVVLDGPTEAVGVELTVDRWCDGAGCSDLSALGALAECAGSATLAAAAEETVTSSGGTSDVR